MDEYAQYQGKFTSYMMAAAVSYSSKLSSSSSFGLNAKISYQHLVELGTGSEKGKGLSKEYLTGTNSLNSLGRSFSE